MIVLFAAQAVPQAFSGMLKADIVETSMESSGSQKLSKEESEKKLHEAPVAPGTGNVNANLFANTPSDRLLRSEREVLLPPPDIC